MAYKILRQTLTCAALFFLQFSLVVFAQGSQFEINRQYSENLFFQGRINNRLIFYNDQKKLFYLNYRKDKWDYDNDVIVAELIEGNFYRVTFLCTGQSGQNGEPGQMDQNQNSGDSKNTEKNIKKSRVIRKSDSVILGIYKSHVSATQDFIRGL